MRFRNLASVAWLALFALSSVSAYAAPDFGPNEQALYDAIIRDDRPAVDAALAAGANANLGTPRYGTTPLVAAIRTKHLALARHLVEKGADAWLAVNRDDRNTLPLDDAAKQGDIPLCEFLLAHGHVPATAFTGDADRTSPIFPAIRGGSLPMLQWLLQHGAKLVPDVDGIPPISMAAAWQREDIVAWLLPLSNVNQPDRSGQTPAFWATSGGNARILSQILKASARIDWMNTENNVFACAIKLDRAAAFERLLAEKPPQAALDLALRVADGRNVSFYENTMHYYERLLAAGAHPEERPPSTPSVAPEAAPSLAPGGLVLLPLPKALPRKSLAAEGGKPPRVGVIADEKSRDFAALIENAFTEKGAYELIERNELEKITRELALSNHAAENDLAARAVGLLDGCDLLILVRQEQAGKDAYFQVNLSAAASGVQIASLALPSTDLAGNSTALRRLLDGREWLLRADPAKLIAASVLNITSDGESRGDERLVCNLIAHQLSQGENVVVLDRENLRALHAEALGSPTDSNARFRAGTFFINGRLSGPLASGHPVELSLEATQPGSPTVLAHVTAKEDGGQPAALVKNATDQLLALVTHKAPGAAVPVDATREIARLTDKMEWCHKMRLFLEEADSADAIAALGGDAPKMRARRALAIASECGQRYDRSFLRWRRNQEDDDSMEHASQITDADFAAQVKLSLTALDALEDAIRFSSQQGLMELDKWPGVEGCLKNIMGSMEIPRRASERHRHAAEIEQVRQRFMQVWTLVHARFEATPKDQTADWNLLKGTEQDFVEYTTRNLKVITTTDEQMEELLMKVVRVLPLSLRAYNTYSDIEVNNGPPAAEGKTAVLQKVGEKLAASSDFDTRFTGLELLEEETTDPRQARECARQKEEMARADLAEKTRLGDYEGHRIAFLRLRNCLWNQIPTFHSWDGTELCLPEYLDFTIQYLENPGLPKDAPIEMHRAQFQAWDNELFRKKALLAREYSAAQLSRMHRAIESQYAVALAKTGGPSQRNYDYIVKAGQVVLAPLDPFSVKAPAEFLEIGKPICDNLRKDFSSNEHVVFIPEEAIYAKNRFWLPAEVNLPDDRYQACFLEIDPVARTLKRHDGPFIELRLVHIHLSCSDGRLVLVQEGRGIWISATGDNWQQVYTGNAASHYRTNTGDCEPALQGDRIAFKRRLVENGQPIDACAVTLLDLKTGHSEDVVNQRRDPLLSVFDDPKQDIYALRWMENAMLQIGRPEFSSFYDPQQKSWQPAPEAKGTYRGSTGSEYFWHQGLPWQLWVNEGDDRMNLKAKTFNAVFNIILDKRYYTPIPVHFEQGGGESTLLPLPLRSPLPQPAIRLAIRGDTQWLLWTGGAYGSGTTAIWISPYDDFMKHFDQAAPKLPQK